MQRFVTRALTCTQDPHLSHLNTTTSIIYIPTTVSSKVHELYHECKKGPYLVLKSQIEISIICIYHLLLRSLSFAYQVILWNVDNTVCGVEMPDQGLTGMLQFVTEFVMYFYGTKFVISGYLMRAMPSLLPHVIAFVIGVVIEFVECMVEFVKTMIEISDTSDTPSLLPRVVAFVNAFVMRTW